MEAVLSALGAALISAVVTLWIERHRQRGELTRQQRELDAVRFTRARETISEFLAAARTMETHAVLAVGTYEEPPIPREDWERFWNAHVLVLLMLRPEDEPRLAAFTNALTAAVRNDNGDVLPWRSLKAPRQALLALFRTLLGGPFEPARKRKPPRVARRPKRIKRASDSR